MLCRWYRLLRGCVPIACFPCFPYQFLLFCTLKPPEAQCPRLSNKTAEEILLTICDAENSDISGSEDKNHVDDTYNVDTEEYDEEQSGSDDDGVPGPGVHPPPTLWKKATSPPDNNLPDIEGGCTFLEERSEYGPIQYFRQYFEDVVLEQMAEQTNRRILQERGVIAKITTEEVKKFFGCSMMMGNNRVSKNPVFLEERSSRWHRR
ncbi:hypothetical protein HPB48_021388 [Haemaphysalis longicornis]|uniref:PiggyBac transposable element-derived protein domain-containing protein n=1 Tax=Haemaphysalis longicornis TaxID=44386 RepID=A0A9J6GIH7_HAELO|nr:hypothetical protein HPB48_021388 [Haemaphysalis longicornis]